MLCLLYFFSVNDSNVMVKSVYGTFAAFLFSDTNTDKRLVQTTITELAVSGYYVVYRFNFAPLTHVLPDGKNVQENGVRRAIKTMFER